LVVDTVTRELAVIDWLLSPAGLKLDTDIDDTMDAELAVTVSVLTSRLSVELMVVDGLDAVDWGGRMSELESVDGEVDTVVIESELLDCTTS
jgi:hypothetical protein